jgi:hypothetical protein
VDGAAGVPAVLGGLLFEEPRRGPVDRLGHDIGRHGEPRTEHLGQADQVASGRHRLSDSGGQAGHGGMRVVPLDVMLDTDNPHGLSLLPAFLAITLDR